MCFLTKPCSLYQKTYLKSFEITSYLRYLFLKCKIQIFIILNKWLFFPSKSLLIKQKHCLNHLKIPTKFPRVCNSKPCLQYTCSLVCDAIDFICNLKLFKAFNRNYFDVADSLETLPQFINYDLKNHLPQTSVLFV